jgi:CubicO group peptidase (beta-lactamase class C family)
MNATFELDRYLGRREVEGRFSGVVLITRGDEVLYSTARGDANRAWRIPNTLDIRFDTASITKLFTSVATLQLVDRGLLSLDTRIIDFLKLEGTTISRDITIFHLLTHSSGMGDDAEEEDGEDYADLWIDKPNYSVTETADFLPQFMHKPANFSPGERCRYCNCSFVLLGLAVEKITGQSYRDYVRENVFKPAGMADTDFFRKDRVDPRVAEGSDPIRDEEDRVVGWQRNIYSYPPVGSPDAGAHVTAADLDRFLRAVKAGDLLSSELTQAFFTPQVRDRDKDDWTRHYSFGLWFYVDADGHVVCCQKEGINAGVSGMIRHFPDRDINAVVLSNMEDGAWSPIWEIHRLVVGGAFD